MTRARGTSKHRRNERRNAARRALKAQDGRAVLQVPERIQALTDQREGETHG